MSTFIETLANGIKESGINPQKISITSDIPFRPEDIKYLGVDYFHTNRGRAVAFGTGLKLTNPSLKVIPIIGDLITLGGNHLVHAGRRNMELTVICINSFIYREIAHKSAPETTTKFSAYSTFEEPFNIPHLANSCGAVYTARWTALHTDELAKSITEALQKNGLSVIEVLAPGLNYYQGIDKIESSLLNFYYENSEIKEGIEPRETEIRNDQKIIIGRFTTLERPTYLDTYNAQLTRVLGDKFIPYSGAVAEPKKEGE